MIHGNNSINETIVVRQQFDRFRGGLGAKRTRGRCTIPSFKIRPRLPRRLLRGDVAGDAGGRGLPGHVWQKQDGQQQARRKTDSRQDRSFSRIYPPFAAKKTRSLGRGWTRSAFQRAEDGLCAATRAGLGTPFWSKLCKGGNVPGANPDTRHSGISRLQTYGQPLERHHGAALPATRQLDATYWHHLSRSASQWKEAEEGTDAIFA